MKCAFWLTLVPKYGPDGQVRKVIADKITQGRPRRGNGVAVKVSLNVSQALFDPVRVEGDLGGETETVVLMPESVREQEFIEKMPEFCADCEDFNPGTGTCIGPEGSTGFASRGSLTARSEGRSTEGEMQRIVFEALVDGEFCHSKCPRLTGTVKGIPAYVRSAYPEYRIPVCQFFGQLQDPNGGPGFTIKRPRRAAQCTEEAIDG